MGAARKIEDFVAKIDLFVIPLKTQPGRLFAQVVDCFGNLLSTYGPATLEKIAEKFLELGETVAYQEYLHELETNYIDYPQEIETDSQVPVVFTN